MALRPEGGWLGVMVKIGQESKTEEEYATRLRDALKDFADGHPVRLLLGRYDWKSAKRAAFCVPNYRMAVERGLLPDSLITEFESADRQ